MNRASIMLLTLIVFILSGCTSSRNVQRDTETDYTEHIEAIHTRMDSLLAGMHMQYTVTKEKLSNLKIENKTVYLSVPDTAGFQYPTAVSETKAERDESESSVTNADIQATLEALVREVAEMRDDISSSVKEIENVKSIPWWDRFKAVVIPVVIICFIIVWIVRSRRRV